MDFAEILKNFGPWVALCVFFVWQSWQREGKLGDALNNSQKYIQDTMGVLVRDNTLAMLGLKELLKQRPCLVEDSQAIESSGEHR